MAELHLDLTMALGPRTLRVALRSSSAALAVVGPSGAGKSTLLRVVAGVERRAAGTVRFEGETWQGGARFVPPWERKVGWVPQDGVLFPHLSVAANLAYAAQLDIEPIARLLGVHSLLTRAPRHLSGGERQRVALGRALASAPRLLLLDEPFSALERPLRAELGGAIAEWTRTHATPMLVITHDEADVRALADEVWELRGDVLSPRAG